MLHYPKERAADRCGLQISDKEGCLLQVSQHQSRDFSSIICASSNVAFEHSKTLPTDIKYFARQLIYAFLLAYNQDIKGLLFPTYIWFNSKFSYPLYSVTICVSWYPYELEGQLNVKMSYTCKTL